MPFRNKFPRGVASGGRKGYRKRYHHHNYHLCELDVAGQETLRQDPPFSPWFVQFQSYVNKWWLISTWHRSWKFYFPSHRAFMNERHRHLALRKRPIIIHPFSKLNVVRESIMVLVWISLFIMDPFIESFYWCYVSVINKRNIHWAFYSLLPLNIICLIDIIMQFYLGFPIGRTKEVVLDHKRIVKRYLTSYFFIDAIPVVNFFLLYLMEHISWKISVIQSHFHVIRFFRMISLSKYLDNLFKSTHYLWLILNSILVIHLSTCWFFMSSVDLVWNNSTGSSWVIKLIRDDSAKGTNLFFVYVKCFKVAMSHFFGTDTVTLEAERSMEEQFTLSCIAMLGMLYNLYLIAVIIELFSMTNTSTNTYNEHMHQLGEYMITKKLPKSLQSRLVMYFEHQYQKRYFEEDFILAPLSIYLRSEIKLHECRNLIMKLQIFNGIPKEVTGTILSLLHKEIFLPGDNIITAGQKMDRLYFISLGTVAVYSRGSELLHLHDGGHFGGITQEGQGGPSKSRFTIVAIEITEVFILMQNYFNLCCRNYPSISEPLMNMANMKFEMDSESAHTNPDVYMNMRKGTILERLRERN